MNSCSHWVLGLIGEGLLHLLVPANTTATVCVPATSPDEALESGIPVALSLRVSRNEKDEQGTATFLVQSGSDEFSAPW